MLLDRLHGLLDALRRIAALRSNVRHDECRPMHLDRGVLVAADDADDGAQAALKGIEQGIERAPTGRSRRFGSRERAA
jgi:hypothetical protein